MNDNTQILSYSINDEKLVQVPRCQPAKNDDADKKLGDITGNSEINTPIDGYTSIKNEVEAARTVIVYIKTWNLQNKDGRQLWYDIQTVEEIAAGDDGWKPTDGMLKVGNESGQYLSSLNDQIQLNGNNATCEEEVVIIKDNDGETTLTLPELRRK
eukprot:5189780-Ditylum_brightwellii.AAC.1